MLVSRFLCPTDHLISALNGIGVKIQEVSRSEEAPLYIWTTPDGYATYVGKRAKGKRTTDEENWVRDFKEETLDIGFSAAIFRTKATPRHFVYEGLNVELLAKSIANGNYWGAFERLPGKLDEINATWSTSDIEAVLIRLLVISGYATYNSTHAGRWEGGLVSPRNLIAFVARHESEHFSFEQPECS